MNETLYIWLIFKNVRLYEINKKNRSYIGPYPGINSNVAPRRQLVDFLTDEHIMQDSIFY
jgi:hypothetical protein